ncbi:antitoxin Xre/MbcA/ParS toxin-binding domain-containing protein [Pseudomonas sp. ZY71]
MYSGDVEADLHWMANPVKGLGGKSPVTMLATREETQSVLDYIRRLEN